MSDARAKVKDLMRLALDERTPDKERIQAAFTALKIIEKHNLLSSPLDAVINIDNEMISAGARIVQRVTESGLIDDVKTLFRGAKKVREGRRRRYR